MPGMKRIFCLAGLGLVLCGLMGSLAGAAGPNAGVAAPDGAISLPAVDGLNAKVSGFGGAADGRALYGGAGSVAVPLGFQYGLQIDALVSGLDSRILGDMTVSGAAAHLFWRDPARGLLGIYSQYLHSDALNGVDHYVGAGQAALYLGRFTLEAVAGVESGNIDAGALGSSNIDSGFFDVAQLAYYPADNLRLSVGHSYILGVHSAWFGAEWGFDVGGRTMASLFANGSLLENGDGAVMGGLRVYFGQRDKTLIRRHREDDPSSVGTASINPMEQTSVGIVANPTYP